MESKHQPTWLTDSTLSKLIASECGDARELGDGTWLPLVMRGGEWADAPASEPSYPSRLEAVMASRSLAKATA